MKFAPFVLVPSSFPRKEFEKAVALQPIINRLMHNVAHDEEFITTTLAETIKVDEFTANLFKIYRKVLAHGFTQVRCRRLAGKVTSSMHPILHQMPSKPPTNIPISLIPIGSTSTGSQLRFIGPLHPPPRCNLIARHSLPQIHKSPELQSVIVANLA